MRVFPSRLRGRLVLIALLAVAPAVGVLALTQSRGRQRAADQTVAGNLRLVKLAASRQAGVFDAARRLLLTLAEFPGLRAADPGACQALLPNILRAHPTFFNVTVTDAHGTSICSAVPVGTGAPGETRGRVWFERALAQRTTVLGDYQLSATTGRPAIVIAHPLLDPAGRVERIINATIGVDLLISVVPRAELPAGATLTLVDRTQTILARFPDGERWIGQKNPDKGPLLRLMAGATEDTTETVGVDGVRRLYVTVPVRAAIETGLYLGMGVDHAAAFREADLIFLGYLQVLAVLLFGAVGAAMVAGHLFVLNPMKALKTVTAQLAAGDLSARTQLASGLAGVGELEEAVNTMASALDSREQERDLVVDELRASENRYRLLFTKNPHAMWVYDVETLGFLEVNDAAILRYGYSRSEFLGMRITDIRPEEDVRRLTAALEKRREPYHHSTGWRHRLKGGDLIDVEISSHTLTSPIARVPRPRCWSASRRPP
jgi:PAS domain S-box-containing protein